MGSLGTCQPNGDKCPNSGDTCHHRLPTSSSLKPQKQTRKLILASVSLSSHKTIKWLCNSHNLSRSPPTGEDGGCRPTAATPPSSNQTDLNPSPPYFRPVITNTALLCSKISSNNQIGTPPTQKQNQIKEKSIQANVTKSRRTRWIRSYKEGVSTRLSWFLQTMYQSE
ncbi:unnamed protein product [Lathyrus oleraceus]